MSCEKEFGLGEEILSKALKEGILIAKNGGFEKAPGLVSLSFHPNLRRYILVYGNDLQTAGFALVEDYGKLWRLA